MYSATLTNVGSVSFSADLCTWVKVSASEFKDLVLSLVILDNTKTISLIIFISAQN